MAPVTSSLNNVLSRTAELLPRATTNGDSVRKAARTGFSIWAIVVIVIVAVTAIFCGVVLCLILKNRRRRKQRQRDFEAKRPKHNEVHGYRALDNRDSSESNSRSRISELPPDNQVMDTTPHKMSELQADTNVAPRVGEIDGHPLPPSYNSPAPVELPASAHTKTTTS